MTHRSFKDESRKNWGISDNSELDRDQIQLGAILRIADATERMCLDREKLERDYQYMRKQRDRYRDLLDKERRRVTALKGVITRMKRKQGGDI